jgi:photosystem II stability/assembly factor-like uncharacterized protein
MPISSPPPTTNTWKQLPLSEEMTFCFAIDSTNPKTLYAQTYGRGVYKSNDGGENWADSSSGLTYNPISCLAIDPPSILYVGTLDNGVWKSNDSGASWSISSTGLTDSRVWCLAIDPTNPETLYAGTIGGGVCKSSDGGANWTASSSGLTNSLVWCLANDPINPQTLYDGTENGVWKSTNGGTSWAISSSQLTDTTVVCLAIDPSNPQTLYAGTSDNGVWKSSDGGVNWASSSSGLKNSPLLCLAIDPSNPQTLYAGTDDAGIWKSIDGGASWADFSSGLTSKNIHCLVIDPSNPLTLYAGTGKGLFRNAPSTPIVQSSEPDIQLSEPEFVKAAGDAYQSLYKETEGFWYACGEIVIQYPGYEAALNRLVQSVTPLLSGWPNSEIAKKVTAAVECFRSAGDIYFEQGLLDENGESECIHELNNARKMTEEIKGLLPKSGQSTEATIPSELLTPEPVATEPSRPATQEELVYAGTVIRWQEQLSNFLSLLLDTQVSELAKANRASGFKNFVSSPFEWNAPLVFQQVHGHVLNACANYEASADIMIDRVGESGADEAISVFIQEGDDEMVEALVELTQITGNFDNWPW